MKRLLSAFVFLLFTMIGFAQSLPKECSAYLPEVLNKTLVFQNDTKKLAENGWGQTGSTHKYWDAYSDRCSNTLYSSPSTSSPNGKSLNFNQKVRIAKIQNGFALVYTENKKGAVSYPKISGDVKCLGWVPMENLLLWSKCPANEFGITRKALVVLNLTRSKNEAFGKISQHPDISNKEKVSKVKLSSDFHYVMKEIGTGNNKRFLISKTDNLSDAITDKVIEGWISENSFTAWNQRSCLEPNWDPDAVSYFMANKLNADLYENSSLSSGHVIQSWAYGQTNDEGEAETKYRFPPRAMRFPILDNDAKSEESFKVTAFSPPDGKMGYSHQHHWHDPRVEQDKKLRLASQINIIFVIDGTRSMGKYYEPICKAILQTTDYFEGEVSVGAVIYRDYSDGDANAIEFHKCVKPDNSSLQNFIRNIGRNGYGATSSPKDLTAHEALYLGLNTAFDCSKMDYSRDNSNLVFIIGDCGNDPNDNKFSMSQILSKANDSRAQLFSFQVINHDKPAWDDFNSQLMDLFIAHMSKLYKGNSVQWSPVQNGLRIDPGLSNQVSFYVSEMYRAQVGKELSEGELITLISGAYKKCRAAIEKQKAAIANFGGDMMNQEGDDNKSVSMKETYLKERFRDYYNTILNNLMLAYEGYSKLNDESGNKYWQPVLFFSSNELVQLNARLEPLAKAARENSYTTESRNNYVSAVAEIIHSMTELSYDEIMKKRTDEISKIIGGLNVSTPMLKGKYTLSDIKNPIACPDQEYKNILKRMSRKIDALSSLTKGTSFKYQYEQNGTRYFWIPLDMIP